MTPPILTNKLWFPNVDETNADGLLAIGGDVSLERLVLAYKNGIFPWYNNNLPLWWHPNPRFVLFPQQLIVSKSMLQLIKKNTFQFTINAAFKQVMQHCQKIKRLGQDGTWLNDDMIDAYTNLHQLGIAHSAEVWKDNKLVGGLYGIKMGKIFFGESMFSYESNASKYALIKYVQQLIAEGIVLIDCQVYTTHLESLGATMIDRKKFMSILKQYIV